MNDLKVLSPSILPFLSLFFLSFLLDHLFLALALRLFHIIHTNPHVLFLPTFLVCDRVSVQPRIRPLFLGHVSKNIAMAEEKLDWELKKKTRPLGPPVTSFTRRLLQSPGASFLDRVCHPRGDPSPFFGSRRRLFGSWRVASMAVSYCHRHQLLMLEPLLRPWTPSSLDPSPSSLFVCREQIINILFFVSDPQFELIGSVLYNTFPCHFATLYSGACSHSTYVVSLLGSY